MIVSEIWQVLATVLVILGSGVLLSTIRAIRAGNTRYENVIFAAIAGVAVSLIGIVYGNAVGNSLAGGLLGFVGIWSFVTIGNTAIFKS